MATYTWDAIYDRLKVDQGGLPNKSTQDMLDTFWTLAGYPDGTLGADAKVAFYESQGAIGDSLGDLENDYWYRIGPNILAAKGAVFAIDAAQSISGEQWALNRGSGGQVLRARYGSVGRAEVRNGVGLVMPAVVGNSAGIPYSATMIPTTSLSLRAVIQPDAAVPSTTNDIISLWTTAGTDRAYRLSIDTAGSPVMVVSSSGSSTTATGTAPAPGFADGVAYSIRADWTASPAELNIYTKATTGNLDDDTGWTLLGGPFTASVPSSIFNSAESVRIGRHAGTSYFGGVIKSALIKVDGVKRLDVDFTAQADLTSSFVASTGQTVTVTAANAVDTNDPLWCGWGGVNYIQFPGSAGGNDVIINHGSNLSSMASLEYKVRVRFTTLGATEYLAGSDSTHFQFWKDSSNLLRVRALRITDFLEIGNAPSAAVPGLVAGEDIWLRAKLTISTAGCEYWYSRDDTNEVDAVSWTALTGGTGTNAGSTPLLTVSQFTMLGAVSTSIAGMNGRMYVGWLAVDGTVRAHVDFTNNSSQSSVACVVGGTATVRRSTTGRKTAVVTRPIWLFGTDDYLEVADNDLLDFAAGDEFSPVVVARLHGTPSAPAMIAKKASYAAADVGYSASINGGLAPRFTLADGSTRAEADGGAVITSGSVFVASTVASSTQVTTRMNTSAGSTLSKPAGTLANSLPLRIGTMSTSTASPVDGEVLAVGVFRRALSATEIAQITAWYNAS